MASFLALDKYGVDLAFSLADMIYCFIKSYKPRAYMV